MAIYFENEELIIECEFCDWKLREPEGEGGIESVKEKIEEHNLEEHDKEKILKQIADEVVLSTFITSTSVAFLAVKYIVENHFWQIIEASKEFALFGYFCPQENRLVTKNEGHDIPLWLQINPRPERAHHEPPTMEA